MKALIVILVVSLLTSSQVYAQDMVERGIYWGEEPKSESTQEKEKPSEKYTRPEVPSLDKLMEMHPREINKLFVEIHEYHVMKPTLDTAKEIQKLKAVMNKKARAAAAVEQMALLENPEISGMAEYAINPTTRSMQRQERDNLVNKRVMQDRNKYALIMLSSKTCGACVVQRNIIANFTDTYGWQSKIVDIDENPMMRERFGITVTPTTLLISKTGEWKVVAIGADALSTLVTNIDRTIRLLSGEINPEQWLTSPTQLNSLYDPTHTQGQ